ncbi:EamA family transporter [Chryseobacterium sp. R2ACT005]|uniref:EamA family transporter n=1 Tax=Chryseobacterium sp. R2ACT005 TaxID=3416668 RepID=UPI003CE81492
MKRHCLFGALSSFLYGRALCDICRSFKKIPAFTVNLTFNLEPVYAIIIAFLFFDESKEVNLSFYIGLAFIIASVVLQTLISIKKILKINILINKIF